MKKLFILMFIIGLLPIRTFAQEDDVYFTPSKTHKAAASAATTATNPGSYRDVDEYNRYGHFGSSYQEMSSDGTGNDIIDFQPGGGLYPDSVMIDSLSEVDTVVFDDYLYDDYTYSRRMSRFDDFYGWYAPWFYDYNPYWYGWYGWHDAWLSPWAYGWYPSWHYAWRYGFYGWPSPFYGYGYRNVYVAHRGVTGTTNHSNWRAGSTRGDRPVANGRFGNNRNAGAIASQGTTRQRSVRDASSSNSRFGGSRSYSNTQNSQRSYSPSTSGTRSNGGFSGGFSGGSRSGGSSGGGGGHFGGRR